jgi:two-component system phosphate regulon sensor histidine kinase PhoR
MSWYLLGFVVLLGTAFIFVAWRKWTAPWQKVEALIRQIGRGEKPRTFLVDAGPEPRRVGIALEDIFNRQQELERQFLERTSGTETILGAMQDGLLVVDAERRITLVNLKFQELFGVQEDVVGHALLEIVRDPILDRLIAKTLETDAPQESELALVDAKNGSSRRIQLSGVPMKDAADLTTGVVVLFHDITQLKQIAELRRDFVANVSHELRTPLSILRGYIETLRDNPKMPAGELTRILEVMERHSKRIGLLVEDLLTLAQLESTHSNLQLSNVRVDDLFFAVVRDWEKKLSEKKLHVVVDLAPEVPIIRADATRLQEVLYNLLDNAVKYSPAGAEIRLHAQRRDGNIVLTVSDTGIGIGEEDLPRIFERFYRVDKARSSEFGGTGLGLSIVKHIAQLHGGVVEAESRLGQGTTIRVLLPTEMSGNNDGVTET